MTLIELLITMTIMAIIAAAILGTASAAIESAREKKTQSLIAKIHTLLMERYASYETRRIDVAPSIVQALDQWAAQATNPTDARARSIARGQMLADARLLGIREMMMREMPDRAEDILDHPNNDVLVLSQPPALAKTYYNRRQQLPAGAGLSSAECLYMVVMNATGDGEARTLFSRQEIDDTDDDGALEFIDGWGNPIGWIRWPAGVTSDLQPRNPDGSRPAEADHDPLDLFRRDSPTVTAPQLSLYPNARANSSNPPLPTFREIYEKSMRDRMVRAAGANMTHQMAYRLVPLIYSGGPDGISGMLTVTPGNAISEKILKLDPYLAASDQNFADGFQNGAPDPEKPGADKDNITNHLIEY